MSSVVVVFPLSSVVVMVSTLVVTEFQSSQLMEELAVVSAGVELVEVRSAGLELSELQSSQLIEDDVVSAGTELVEARSAGVELVAFQSIQLTLDEVVSAGAELVLVRSAGVDELVLVRSAGVEEVELYAQSDQVSEDELAVVSAGVELLSAGVVVVIMMGVELVVESATGVLLIPPSTGAAEDQSPQVWVPLTSRRAWNFSCL